MGYLNYNPGLENFLFATRHNGTTPKKSVAKLEPGLKTWSPKQNTKAKNCNTVQKKKQQQTNKRTAGTLSKRCKTFKFVYE